MGVGRGGRANVFMEELLYSSSYIGYFHGLLSQCLTREVSFTILYCLEAEAQRS